MRIRFFFFSIIMLFKGDTPWTHSPSARMIDDAPKDFITKGEVVYLKRGKRESYPKAQTNLPTGCCSYVKMIEDVK